MQRAADVLQLSLTGRYAGAAAFRADAAVLVVTRMQSALFRAGTARHDARFQDLTHDAFTGSGPARGDGARDRADVRTVEA